MGSIMKDLAGLLFLLDLFALVITFLMYILLDAEERGSFSDFGRIILMEVVIGGFLVLVAWLGARFEKK